MDIKVLSLHNYSCTFCTTCTVDTRDLFTVHKELNKTVQPKERRVGEAHLTREHTVVHSPLSKVVHLPSFVLIVPL